MGLITGILGLPVAPLRGVIAAAEQVRRQAEEEFYDPVAIRHQLEEVQRLREEGSLTEEEAIMWEDELIERNAERGARIFVGSRCRAAGTEHCEGREVEPTLRSRMHVSLLERWKSYGLKKQHPCQTTAGCAGHP